MILENPSEDGPFGAKAIGEMANNAQPPAIANAIFDAVGVWVTEMPATPERVLEAIEAKREPRRDGKRVIFDEHISVQDGLLERRRGLLRRRCLSRRPFRTWNGRDAWEFVDGVRLHAIGGEQVLLCRVALRAGQAGAVARARGHRAGDVHPRRRGRDDDRGRDEDARPRATSSSSTAACTTSSTRRAASRSSRRSRRCRSTTFPTRSSTSCSAPTAARSTWSS